MKKIHAILAATLALGLSACVGVPDQNEAADVGDGVSVTPSIEWADVNLGYGRIWTTQGVGLDEIHFYTGVKSGQPLFAAPGVPKGAIAPYDSKMLANDVEDLLVASLAKKKYQSVKADHLAPCPFGAATGFCFDLHFTDENGLEMRGKARALQRDGRLDLILFQAPSEYYFAMLSPSVDKLFSSIVIKPESARRAITAVNERSH